MRFTGSLFSLLTFITACIGHAQSVQYINTVSAEAAATELIALLDFDQETDLIAGNNYTFTVQATDPDGIEWVRLVVKDLAPDGLNSLGERSFSPDAGTTDLHTLDYTFTPGDYRVNARMRDLLGNYTWNSYYVTVQEADGGPPVTESIALLDFDQETDLIAGNNYSFTIQATDPEGIEWVRLVVKDLAPDGLNSLGERSYSPDAGTTNQHTLDYTFTPGEYRVNARMRDLLGNYTWNSYYVTVQEAPSTPYNVIVVIVDDLRDHDAFTPNEIQMPNFDRIRAKSLTFSRAYCQYPVCNPSRASTLTGKRPPSTGVWKNDIDFRNITPDVVTLPQAFKQSGYYTGGFGKVYHGNKGDTLSWNEETYYRDPVRYIADEEAYADDPNFYRINDQTFMFQYRVPEEDVASYGLTDKLTSDDVTDFIDFATTQTEQPFFLVAGYHKPHTPYIAPTSYFDLYPAETMNLISEPTDLVSPDWWETPRNTRPYFDAMDTYHKQLMMASYAATTTYADGELGRLLDKMDALNLWENTILVFYGDHGFHLGEHNNHWGKATLYELSARVPMTIYAPGMSTGGQTTEGIVELIDIYPTLAELAGITPPSDLEGESLVPLLNDPTRVWDNEAITFKGPRLTSADYSVATSEYRYSHWPERGQGRNKALYDRINDPGEHYNLISGMTDTEIAASPYADIVAEMEYRYANPSSPQ